MLPLGGIVGEPAFREEPREIDEVLTVPGILPDSTKPKGFALVTDPYTLADFREPKRLKDALMITARAGLLCVHMQ